MDASRRLRTACGLALLALAGCYGPPTYAPSPYGPTMAPPVYTTPPGGMPIQPQESYPQGVVPQQGTLTPADPQVGSQPYTRNKTPVYDESAPVWHTPQPAAPQNGARGTGSPTTGDNLVPQYDDPNAGAPQPVPQNGSRQPRPAEPTEIDLFDQNSPFQRDGMGMNDSAAEPGPVFASGDDVEFGEPAMVQTSFSETSEAESGSLPPEPNPFDHDGKEFRWLRGIVDFDAREKRWHLLYDLNPEVSDELGGEIALAGDPQIFRGLSVQDVVLVEGRLDTASQDRFGKPCYLVEHLQRLQPLPADAHGSSSAGKQGLGTSPWNGQGT